MKLLKYLTLILPGLAMAQSADQNYITTKTYRETNQGNPVENIQYFDGLGRPIQTISKSQAPEGKDIITHIEYDALGRQPKDYLPYVNGNGSLNFRPDAGTNTQNFYVNKFGDSQAFSEKRIEQSPLNRVFRQGAPGTPWNVDNGNPIRFEYHANSNEDQVINIKVTLDASFNPTYSIVGNYPENTLYKNIVFDENGNKSEEFKNVKGQIILKRNFVREGNTLKPLNTYYVYDDFDNLTLVLPPNFPVNSSNISNDERRSFLAYEYRYNDKNLLVYKRLPGKRYEEFVYDNKNRLIGSSNVYSPNTGIQNNTWYYTFYDDFNRIKYTGNKSGGTFNPNISHTSTNILTENFYDSYPNFNNITLPEQVLGQSVNLKVKGLQTGSLVAVIDEGLIFNNVGNSQIKYNKNVTLYDHKYRPIAQYIFYPNEGYLKVESLLDFSGKTLETHTFHKENQNAQEIYIKEVFTYSPEDRLLSHTHQINNGAIENLAVSQYDDLGQVIQKHVGGNGIPLQTVDYNFNIRGWLTGINNIAQPQDKLFNFKIKYNEADVTDINPEAQPLYNGNIAATQWSAIDNVVKNYTYKYDEINRLLKADYKDVINTTHNFNEELTYDEVGNIKTLKRMGIVEPLSGNSEHIDNLTYKYHSQYLNRLSSVNDASNNAEGFNQNNIANNTVMYTYDRNGNMTSDLTKGITQIIYNHLNLPTSITFNNGGKIEYIYTADGVKLYKKVYQDTAQPPVVTTYRNGFQYVDGVLKFFPHAEGYVNVAENGNFEYIYNYTDHLGNVRLSYKYDQTATETNNIAIVDANNYYPFGLKHKGYASPNENPIYKYKYNGKELQDELGLNFYDYGARNYDATIGRWMNVDPLAEMSRRWTPYAYAYNSPKRFIDPDGMLAQSVITDLWNKSGNGKTTWTNINGTFYNSNGDSVDSGQSETPPHDITVGSDGKVTSIVRNGKPNRFFDENGIQIKPNDPTIDNQFLEGEFKIGDQIFTPVSNSDLFSFLMKAGIMPTITLFGLANRYLKTASASHQAADFGYNQLRRAYNESYNTEYDGGLGNGTFYRFNNTNTIYNLGDAGNFLWGAWMSINQFSAIEVKVGSQVNSIFTLNGWDTYADQKAIMDGFNLFK